MELTIERLSKQYGSKIAVDRLSSTMHAGVYGLLGANGAGKTTLMRMLCGILTPTSGEVKLNGANNIELGEEYRDVLGYLPQDFGYYPNFTALEFLLYMSSLKGLTKAEALRKSAALIEKVGLADCAKKKVKTFSGGMKQRLGIAQAMLNDPKILILDEPTAGLDPKERVRFRNMLADFAKDRIVILSTHIVSDVEYISDEILLMKKGCLISRGTAERLTAQVQGKVFECTMPQKQADELSQSCIIANLHHVGDNVLVRLITDKQPPQGALEAAPTLEDLYLYCFSDEERGAL
ncbi:MAG: ABC transporter ATP-binding protein [Clostridia bacterium]|nr:ABC transporter ATP-binding protein [Clostridia bacterium]NLS85683.1 ABC transporter ATP-binding protein [Oscillospiraceae bacterium]